MPGAHRGSLFSTVGHAWSASGIVVFHCRPRLERIGDRCFPLPAAPEALDAELAQQALDGAARHAYGLTVELGPDLVSAIDAPSLRVDAQDLNAQRAMTLSSLRDRSHLGRVVRLGGQTRALLRIGSTHHRSRRWSMYTTTSSRDRRARSRRTRAHPARSHSHDATRKGPDPQTDSGLGLSESRPQTGWVCPKGARPQSDTCPSANG